MYYNPIEDIFETTDLSLSSEVDNINDNIISIEEDITALDGRITTLEDNKTIYQIFEFIGLDATGQLTFPTESVLFDFYSDNIIDAICVKADISGNPSEELSVNALGQIVTVSALDINGNYILSSIPSLPACIIYFVIINDEFKSNITEDIIVSEPISAKLFLKMDIDGTNSDIQYLQFNLTPTAYTPTEGRLAWNSTDGTLDLGMSGGNITQQIGQELFIKVWNDTGILIPNGTPVYFNGRQGNRPKVHLAKSDSDSTSSVMGITTQDLTATGTGREGYITSVGYVRQIKTNYSGLGNWGTTWNEGDKLYVSKDIAGQLTNIEPSAPHHSDIVGTVGIVGNIGVGSILVDITRHYTLQELTDVNGTPLLTTYGQILVWQGDGDGGLVFDFTENILDYQKRKITDNTDVASVTNVGMLRYRVSGNNSYLEICMQNGASSYIWTPLIQQNW